VTDVAVFDAQRPPLPDRAPSRLRGRAGAGAFLYLAALGAAEATVRRVDPGWGLVAHAALLNLLLALAARHVLARTDPDDRPVPAPDPTFCFLVALILPPLVRVVALALPAGDQRPATGAAVLSAPVIVAGLAAMRAAGYRPREVGLRPRLARSGLPLDLLVGASGVLVGYAEHRLLAPAPLVEVAPSDPRGWLRLALPLLLVAFAQELVLRGVLPRAAAGLLGAVPGVLFAAAVSATMVGAVAGPLAFPLAFAVAAAFGAAVRLSGSILGVTLAHAAAGIAALIVFPLVGGGG